MREETAAQVASFFGPKKRAARLSATSSPYQVGRILGFTLKQFCDLGISCRKYFSDAVTRSAS